VDWNKEIKFSLRRKDPDDELEFDETDVVEEEPEAVPEPEPVAAAPEPEAAEAEEAPAASEPEPEPAPASAPALPSPPPAAATQVVQAPKAQKTSLLKKEFSFKRKEKKQPLLEEDQGFDEKESEDLLRGFLSGELYRRGLICRADDRGDPVVQLAPPLIADSEQFEEIHDVLHAVLGEAWKRVRR